MQMSRSPYQGLRPYTQREAHLFFGRDVDRQIIIANLYAARLTILYGPSGVGKSSLLEAGVAYQLQQQPLQVVVIFKTWYANPLAGLKQAIRQQSQVLPQSTLGQDGLKLDQLLFECARGLPSPLIVILDQFEEYFLYHPHDDGPRSFAAEFARAVNRGDCPANFLISIREDAFSKLDRFERRIAHLFDNYLHIEHLDKAAAMDAITRPLEVYNQGLLSERQVKAEESLIEEIIKQVQIGQVFIGRGGRGQAVSQALAEQTTVDNVRVEAPYLQLVLARLWNEELKRKSNMLRLATLTALGGASQIVHTHLDTALKKLKPEQRDISTRIFNFLVTPSGTKVAHTAGDLARYAAAPTDRVEEVLRRLAEPDLRVLRSIESDLGERAEIRYEIFHDVLAPAVLDWSARNFGRLIVSRRLMFIVIAVISIGMLMERFGSTLLLPPLLFGLERGGMAILLNSLALMQVYKWFSRSIGRGTAAFFVIRDDGPDRGFLLGVLFTLLFYMATKWPAGIDRNSALGIVTFTPYLTFLVFTIILTLFFGVIIFVTMLAMSRVTYRFFKRFDIGFYGVYFAICVLLVALIILYLVGILQLPLINLSRVQAR